jgi:hypothetical protein
MTSLTKAPTKGGAPTSKKRQKPTRQAAHPMNEDDVMEEPMAEKAKNTMENSTGDAIDIFGQEKRRWLMAQL